MSNTSNGKGIKGSKYWIQNVIENEVSCKKLNNMISDDTLIWLSPLAPKYREYQLNEEYIYSQLGLSNSEAKKLFDFWPNRQPQWDAIALSQDKSTLYLVEAKAHLEELESKCMATSPKSVSKIYDTLKYVMKEYYNTNSFDAWTNNYYQLANRLAFLRILNEKPFGMVKTVKLVLLNFANDHTYKPTSKAQWEKHYREVFKEMVGKENAPNDVILIIYQL